IAVALVLATRVPPRSLPARAGLLAAAIVAGAATGECALAFAGFSGARSDPSALFGGIVQWAGLASCAAGIHFLWLRSNRARAAARAQQLQWSTTEALRIQTQLQSLRYQIDPHFLFNTLATIRRLQETDSAEGARLLRHLLDYLRSAGRTPGQRTTLGDEIDLVRSYLAIVGTRMRERLTTVFDVPDDLRRHGCPPLSLATLAENAVKHGIGPAPDGGAIRVQARRHGETLEVCVEDTGVGLSQTAVGGAGIGLANIRARLRALYGDAASLTIAGNSPQGVRAVIRMPLEPRPRP
ncbi:MAG: sensor histidine kinase, partial [Candidatus Levyibacteriota bacterium]